MHIDGRENTWCICSLIYWPLSILCYEENDKFVYVCRISMNNSKEEKRKIIIVSLKREIEIVYCFYSKTMYNIL